MKNPIAPDTLCISRTDSVFHRDIYKYVDMDEHNDIRICVIVTCFMICDIASIYRSFDRFLYAGLKIDTTLQCTYIGFALTDEFANDVRAVDREDLGLC
jgi:hypothetical protein